MKRIITLFIGVCVSCSISVSAQSNTHKVTQSDAPTIKEMLQLQLLETTIDVAKTQSPIPSLVKNSVREQKQLPAFSAKATQQAAYTSEIDTIELEFDNFYADPLYYESGDWVIVLQNPVYQFTFDFYNNNPQSCAGTYTVDELDSWVSNARIPAADGKTSYFQTCDMTITAEQVSANLVRYTLDAFVVTTLGRGGEVNGVFKLHATHTIITADKYVETATYYSTVTLGEEGDRFVIEGKNDSVEVSMTLFTGGGGVVGYYNETFIDIENTTMKYNGQSYTPMTMEAVIYSAEMMMGGIAYVAMMEILTTDTTFFNIAMEAPVVPVDTVEITCKNLQLVPEQGAVVIIASNNDYEFYGAYNDVVVNTPALYNGINAKMFITDKTTGREIESLLASFSVDGNEAKGYTVDIEMLGSDHKYYLANLSWLIPTPIDTIDVTFAQSSKAKYYIDDLGLEEMQLANYNEEYSAAFDILYVDQIMGLGGEFTLSDLYAEQSFLIHHTDMSDVYIDMSDLKGRVWQANDTTFLEAAIIGFDSILYNVSMYYAVPTPIDTISYTFKGDEVNFTNALPQGVFILDAMAEDGLLLATIYVEGIENGSVEGTFIKDAKFQHHDFYDEETFISVWNAEAKTYDNYAVLQGEMLVTLDEEKNIIAEASFICEDAKQYNLTFITPFQRAHLQYDTEYGEVDYTYGADARVHIQSFIESYNMIYLELTPADLANVTSVYFYAEAMDPVIGIPEGVYPINGTGKIGTVVASNGVSVMGYPLESYFCTLDNFDGELYYGSLYCMVDGTITVTNNNGKLQLDVDAVNSYDVPIKLHYCSTQTDVENVIDTTVGVEKRVINGQMVIIRNGYTYTITGAQIK